jgi:hypothetical protein
MTTLLAAAEEKAAHADRLRVAAEARVREVEEALRQIRDYEPERETFRFDNEACPDCKRNRERHWPPSELCEKHYCQMDDNRRANSDVDARQHHRMRELARAALAATPDARPDPRATLDWIEHNVSGGLHLVATARAKAHVDPRLDLIALEWIRANDPAALPASPQATTPRPSSWRSAPTATGPGRTPRTAASAGSPSRSSSRGRRLTAIRFPIEKSTAMPETVSPTPTPAEPVETKR